MGGPELSTKLAPCANQAGGRGPGVQSLQVLGPGPRLALLAPREAVMSKLTVVASIALLGIAACTSRDVSALDPKPAIEIPNTIPVASNRNVDILFLIDNSDSMKDKQDQLRTNFPK